MGKRMLNRSLVLSALMTLVVTGNVLAAEFTFGTDKKTGVTSFNGDWTGPIPIQPWGYPLLGQMYYPKSEIDSLLNVVKNNIVTANSEVLYDNDGAAINNESGLFLASGFYEVTVKENAKDKISIGDNKIILNNGTDKQRRIFKTDGLIEMVAGYYSKYTYGTGSNNGLKLDNINMYSKSSAGLYGLFANQKSDIDPKKTVKAINNWVIINNSMITAEEYIAIHGADVRRGTVDNNKIEITDSSFETESDSGILFYGGIAEITGSVTRNSVNIKNNAENTFVLRNTEVYGGYASEGTATNNTVTISNSNLTGSELYGGYTAGGAAIDNTVTISNSNLTDSKIYGGYTANGNATNNTVTISNSNLIGSSLYGGYSDNEGQITGNTLNLGSNITGKLNTIGGFNTINFANIDWENGGTIIETENLELVDTAVNIQNITGDPKVNDYMNLIVSDAAIKGELINKGEQTVKVSAAQVVKATTGNLEQESNAIKFTIVGSELNPQVGALGDANAVAGAFVANGAGLVEDSINAMMCEERIGYKTFAQVHGSNLDFDTPNNLNVKGWSGIVGVGETTKDRITYGMFFETGKGDYYTLAQQSTGYVRGDGELDYRGGGVLVRKDNENGTYVEASLRAGRMDNELNDAVLDGHNKLQGFDISSTYYGAHIGVGKIIPRGERESLDVYGKFLYSRYDGDSFVIDGDKFNLDDVDSQKLRVGFRYNELNGEKLRMYYGAAYEYEFDTKAKNSVLNYTFDSPDLGGSTIIGELGFHYNADEKWCIDVNLRGYGGEREGVSGSIQANYMF